MQLVDNVYLPQRLRDQRDLKYKIIQAKLAEQLEAKHSKNWILTSYLNDVPYGTVGGQTAYGVGAAVQMFFNKPVWKLNLAQMALLAGLPQAPSQYNPFIDAGAARRRRTEVLQAMVTAGYITQAQANAADRKRLEVQNDTAYEVRQQPYVFDYIQQAVAKDLCPQNPGRCPTLTHGGLKIYTTIDLRKQALAKQAILDHESTLAGQGGPGAAAAGLASIDPNNGHILAIASSSDYNQTKFDYATQAQRQPGSSFKVFALMTLIHDYDGDPERHLLHLAASCPPGGCRRTRPGRCTPPRTPTRATSTSPRRRSCPTTPCSRSWPPTWAGTSSTRPPTRWASPPRWTATRPR